YFKQIVKSARTNAAAGSQEENDDFLGCLDIPLSVSLTDRTEDWNRLPEQCTMQSWFISRHALS
ncbi:hypothetical protein scyTo_0026235, partial [Scyliorhinus torazame]|nr:hypothetical protein [Scyliorhinus torazame]